MNVLAEKQKRMFETDISLEEFNKRQNEFLKIYFDLRAKDESKIWNQLSLKERRSIHKSILRIYKLKNLIGGFSYELIKDERLKTDRPVIFAVTHVGKFDIEVISESIKDHYYLLSGDYEHIQGIIDSPFLYLNGVFFFNEFVKDDRKKVSEKMVNHLNEGGNLMYFIEGTWNLTPNLPMLPCYWGIVDIAKQGNAIIIPVAADQYGKHFKINIGKNFDMNSYGDSPKEKSNAINDLRDTLSTLKWEIWESEPLVKREDVAEKEWEDYIKKRLKEWPYFNKEYIKRLVYKPKNIVDNEEAFDYISDIVYEGIDGEPYRLNNYLPGIKR